jgi:hypothetical protein
MPYENGPFMCLEIPNEDTGQLERKYISIPELFNRIWDEYIRLMIPDEYCREMLKELGLSETEVFHMMERLQGGKAEFQGGDYAERSYT